MIDIHTHVLPQVDDGPGTWEESMALLQRGEEDGIRGAVCTSHVLDRLDERVEAELTEKFETLKRMASKQGLKMSLWLGSEIHTNAQFDLRSKLATFNGNGKYTLIELPMGDIPKDVEEKFFQIRIEGVYPILAHPERNSRILQNPKTAFQFAQKGVLLQLNAGSILGKFGKRVKRLANEMLDHQMVHFVASDCHAPNNRSMVLSNAYDVVDRGWGTETAERLFRINPYKSVIGEDIIALPPLPFEEGKRKSVSLFGLQLFKNR